MRKRLVSILGGVTFLAMAAPLAHAHDGMGGNVGLGVGFGAPSGLSLELAATHESSFEAALGFNAFDNGGTYFHLVYKTDFTRLAEGPTVSVPVYVGIGGYVFNYDRRFAVDNDWGLRFPIGLNFDFLHVPLQIFAEVAVGVALADYGPEPDHHQVWVGGYSGVRYWF